MKIQTMVIGVLFSSAVFAQKKSPDNWPTLDPKKDGAYGVGAEEAYKTLGDKKGKEIIVAVIDSGTDPKHEDLKDIIWVNPGEIPDNNIDDDKNGYIDDINGWSFLGGKNGDIAHEATELARIVQKGNKKYRDLLDPSKLTEDEKKDYEQYKKLKEIYTADIQTQESSLRSIEMVEGYLQNVKKANNGVLNKAAFKNYVGQNDMEVQMTKRLKLAFAAGLVTPEELESQLKEGHDHFTEQLRNNKMNADSIRAYVVGDNVDDPNERYYGNNHVWGPEALHGTHVAGIIAAMRDNNLGIKGIAKNVKIMIVRAVPDGDERDKDVANAIRYAVDNGASVINMSFGKYYSPDKKVVDEAVKYALSKDVLLVHAAGNESKDNDIELSYPSREMLTGETVPNWIQVGASGYKKEHGIIGSFSNYGKNKVDLFAPGVGVYSTIPDNKYIVESGTSMASPATAGAAAIIRSYFPELKAAEVRTLLMKTVVPYKQKVNVPGKFKGKKGRRHVRKKMTELCISGGFVNVNNAVKEAMKK